MMRTRRYDNKESPLNNVYYLAPGRVRTSGGGRKRLEAADPGLDRA